MKTNSDKYQTTCKVKKTNDNIKFYRIGDIDITCEIMTVYWVLIMIMCKGLQTISRFKRTRQIFNQKGKMVIYHSLIASNFSYCPLA